MSEHTGLFERFLSSQCFLFASFSPLHSIACLICRRRDENLKPYVLKFEPPQPLKARTQTHHPAVVCAKLSAESLLKTWTKSEGHMASFAPMCTKTQPRVQVHSHRRHRVLQDGSRCSYSRQRSRPRLQYHCPRNTNANVSNSSNDNNAII